jgi:membrane protease YdiL (CAAX protease family)
MTTHDDNKPYRNDTRKFALLALATYIISELVMPIEVMLSRGKTGLSHSAPIMGKWIIFNWLVPFLIVLYIEKKDHKSLGLWIPKERRVRYLIYAVVGFFLPGLIVGFGGNFPLDMLEQIVYIGLAEEFFYRGYIMNRLCKWLGNLPGLLITSFLFGLGHITFRLIYHGFDALIPALTAGGQSFMGGLIFGLIYLKVRNIWPGAIIHISTNLYLPSIITILTAK